jgi:hypothetical protein
MAFVTAHTSGPVGNPADVATATAATGCVTTPTTVVATAAAGVVVIAASTANAKPPSDAL